MIGWVIGWGFVAKVAFFLALRPDAMWSCGRLQTEPDLEISGSLTRAGNKARMTYSWLFFFMQVIFHHLRYSFSPATIEKL
jgi:hypothetical protein